MRLDTIRRERPRWLGKAAGLGLGLALFGAVGLPGVMAQEEGVTVGGGASIIEAPLTSNIKALVNSILAEVLGEANVAGDATVGEDSLTTGGDINVGGNMGGSVTTGGGMGGGISIGGGGSGTLTVE